jgi:hypothetical protein
MTTENDKEAEELLKLINKIEDLFIKEDAPISRSMLALFNILHHVHKQYGKPYKEFKKFIDDCMRQSKEKWDKKT